MLRRKFFCFGHSRSRFANFHREVPVSFLNLFPSSNRKNLFALSRVIFINHSKDTWELGGKYFCYGHSRSRFASFYRGSHRLRRTRGITRNGQLRIYSPIYFEYWAILAVDGACPRLLLTEFVETRRAARPVEKFTSIPREIVRFPNG